MHEAAKNNNGKVEAVKNPETLYLSRTKHPFAIKCIKVSRERTRPAWAGFKTAEEGRTKIM